MAREINTVDSFVGTWIKQYKAFGDSAFETSNTNSSYTKKFKEMVILDYLNGGGSYDDLVIKYHISSSSPINITIKTILIENSMHQDQMKDG